MARVARRHSVASPTLADLEAARQMFEAVEPRDLFYRLSMQLMKDVALADAVLRACHDFWAATEPATASQVADQVWGAGCRDPHITAVRAVGTAEAGRSADLRTAISDCLSVMRYRAGNTDPNWSDLGAVTAQLEARLKVLVEPGNPHRRAVTAKRPPRPPRFLRPARPVP